MNLVNRYQYCSKFYEDIATGDIVRLLGPRKNTVLDYSDSEYNCVLPGIYSVLSVITCHRNCNSCHTGRLYITICLNEKNLFGMPKTSNQSIQCLSCDYVLANLHKERLCLKSDKQEDLVDELKYDTE